MGMSNPSAGVYVHEVDMSQIVVGTSSSIGAIVGESHRGPSGVAFLVTSTKQFLELFGMPDARVSYLHYSALAFLEHGSRLYVTRVAPEATYGGASCFLDNNLNSSESWAEGLVDPTLKPFQPADLFHVYGHNPGLWNDDIQVRVYPNTNQNDGTFYVDVYLTGQGQPVERYLVSLDYRLDGYGVQLNIQEHINKRSAYIQISQNYDQAALMADPYRSFINALNVMDLVGGTNPRKATSGEIIQAWEDLYSDPEVIRVNLLINGGYSTPEVQIKMTQLCEDRMDCMAILDVPPMEQRLQDAINYRRNTLQLDTSYSALYSPDYLVLDQYNDIKLYVPPSGYVAAAYARTDSEFELWFAPAGMNRGRLNILGVRQVYNQGDRDALYESQINATRVISGAGIKIWGADTLQAKASALSNVSVRRLMMFLETSLSEAALYSVFDPNDYILRAQLVELCERFLMPIKNARGLYSFGVVCDDSNNTPNTVANGDLILDVYVDPVLPAKRIHLTAVVNRTGAKFLNQ